MLASVQVSWFLSTVTMVTASLLACDTGQPSVEPTDTTAASQPVTPDPVTPDPVTPDPVTPEPVMPEPQLEPEPEHEQTSVPPEGEVSDACQVMLVLEARGDKKLVKPVTLLARAKNLTSTPLELRLKDRCPGGEAQFSGLGDAYDYYATCAMGACAGGRPPRVIALPPGETVDISSTDIAPDGDAPCNEPIAARKYELTFTLPLEGASNPVLCGPTPLVLRKK
jgi:hypothetical protein